MKKALLFTVAALLLTASASFAVGLNLGWGSACPSLAASLADQSDPCDGTGGPSYNMVGSVVAPAGLTTVTSEEISIDLQEGGVAVLSNYWHLEAANQPGGGGNPPGCRGDDPLGTGNVGSMLVSASSALLPTGSPCIKTFWGSSPSGGINYAPDFFAPGRARLGQVWAKSPGTAMTSGSQYDCFLIQLDDNHQVGTAAGDANFVAPYYLCSGCHDGVCIVFNSCKLTEPPGVGVGDVQVTTPSTRNWVTWQGGINTNCPTATPTKTTTWGAVKSLYR